MAGEEPGGLPAEEAVETRRKKNWGRMFYESRTQHGAWERT